MPIDFDENKDIDGIFPRYLEDSSSWRVGFKDVPAAVDTAPDEGAAEDGAREYLGLAVKEPALRRFIAVLFFLLLVVVVRTGIYVADGADYASKAEHNRLRKERVPTERGIVYDRNGQPLVRNVPSFSVIVTPADLPKDAQQRREILADIGDIIGVEPMEMENELKKYESRPADPVIVKDDVTHDQAVLIDIESVKMPGVALETGTRRSYLGTEETPSLSHILGYESHVDERDLKELNASCRQPADGESGGQRKAGAVCYTPADLVGRTGVEQQYEGLLRGLYGSRNVEMDAAGRWKRTVSEDKGEAGQNLILSIDLDLQKFAEKALADELAAVKKKRASLIALDPRNGEILALVSLPAFDGNFFTKSFSNDDYANLISNPDMPLFQRAVAGQLPAGSTFKLAVAAGGLEEGIVTPNTSFLSTGGLYLGKAFYPDWKAGGHGETNLSKAIAESVNTYFYEVGGGKDGYGGLGPERIVEYAQKFGFGSRLGVDLPGEKGGLMPTKEWKKSVKGQMWYPGDTYHIAIGQGDVLVTPLQVAAMTSVIANGGTLYRPRVLDAVMTDAGSRTVKEPEIIRQSVVKPSTIEAIRKGMRQAVTQGSARLLGDLPVAVAAKTGTAQWTSDPKKETHAWFTSFAPYQKPELVITVVIEEGGEGSAVSAPVARQIYDWYFKRKTGNQ